MAQPNMGRVGRGHIADWHRNFRKWQYTGSYMGALPGPLLQMVATWNSMLELLWVVLPGPPLSLIARYSFRLHGRLPRAQPIFWELYLVSFDAEAHIFFVGASLPLHSCLLLLGERLLLSWKGWTGTSPG